MLSNFRLPPLPASLTRLFDAPVTGSYAGLTLLLSGLTSSLVFPANTLPTWPKYLLMLLLLGWLARVCDSAVLRWAWLGTVSVLLLGLALEVGTLALQ
jgi:hypothetical protein